MVQATDAVIRELGRRRRHFGGEYFYEGTSKALPKYATKYLDAIGVDSATVEQQLNESGVAVGGSYTVGLDPEKLYLMQPPSDSEDRNTGEWVGWRLSNL